MHRRLARYGTLSWSAAGRWPLATIHSERRRRPVLPAGDLATMS